jgi:hypothetical protein
MIEATLVQNLGFGCFSQQAGEGDDRPIAKPGHHKHTKLYDSSYEIWANPGRTSGPFQFKEYIVFLCFTPSWSQLAILFRIKAFARTHDNSWFAII